MKNEIGASNKIRSAALTMSQHRCAEPPPAVDADVEAGPIKERNENHADGGNEALFIM
ncbi:hypothetical protein [Bradyrhizobium acaciae]|uniref:hypothetical protein n=1 Tax=Bradyrhizobium acaciae TaxID=2683706 RepID=UPI001E30B749|nr:hypothetical protein [Bradyrhizobium acaciae]MCC8978494.1 hypothetical protein [Bradyrhizobium acaciae]